MKKILFFIISLLFYLNSFSQFEKFKSPFENGFSTGFKEGYCYGNQNVDCFTPTVPLTPLPNINERKDNFRDGYNRGFQLGLDLKRIATGGGTTSPSGISYSSVPNYKFNDYIPQVPVDAYANAELNRQKIYDANVRWIQDRIDFVLQFNSTLLKDLNYPYYDAVNKGITNYFESTKGKNIDWSIPDMVNQVKTMLDEKERQIYQAYLKGIEEANSILIDLNNNNQDNSVDHIVTKKVRVTKFDSHTFYLENNLKDSLQDDKMSVYTFTDETEQGNVVLYLKENKSYYLMNCKDYYNQSIGTLIRFNYLSTTDAIAILAPGGLSIIDMGEEVDGIKENVKVFKTVQGFYSKFIVFKNKLTNKRYFIPTNIVDNQILYQPLPIFSK